MADPKKTTKQLFDEAMKKGLYASAITQLVKMISEGDKDKKLISLNSISKSAILIKTEDILSKEQTQKTAGRFAMKELKEVKSGDVFGLIKKLSASYLQMKASEDASKPATSKSTTPKPGVK